MRKLSHKEVKWRGKGQTATRSLGSGSRAVRPTERGSAGKWPRARTWNDAVGPGYWNRPHGARGSRPCPPGREEETAVVISGL